MKAPEVLIAYVPEAIAPHHGMLAAFMEREWQAQTSIKIRILPNNTWGRTAFAFRVLIDALTHRRAVLYFGSFLSAPYALIALLALHPRWIYHSQDWIADGSGIGPKAESVVVKYAPVVIWNEASRAERARSEAGRNSEILILPTYLPRSFQAPARSNAVRRQIAERAGAVLDRMVVVFAGGGYSRARLSDQLLEAFSGVDDDTVLVFTGADRLPEGLARSNVLDMGLLDYSDMMQTLASSDIGILLYDHVDSFGNRYQQPGRLTEYTTAGLGLIATPFADAERLACDADFCTTVAGYDPDEIRDALVDMVARIRNGSIDRDTIRRFTRENMAFESYAGPILDKVSQILL